MRNKLKIIITLTAAIAMMASAVPLPSTAGPQEPDQSIEPSEDPAYAPDQSPDPVYAPDAMDAPDVAGGPVISFDVFYQSLRPYGRWINYSNYGQVWIPSLGSGFEPYSTNGHWVYTNYGWTWVSDYSWGWGPFHYGRWLFDNGYGWIWVPGQQWAPAWVAWRNSPDYYGWAPLGPGMSIGISIGIPTSRWCFIPRQYFGGRYAHRYYVPRTRNVTIINNTTVIRNVNVYQNNRYFTGPSRTDVQHATRRTIRPVRIASASRAGTARVSNRELSIYRPSMQMGNSVRTAPARNGSSARPAPRRMISPNESSRNHISPANGATSRSQRSTPVQQATPRTEYSRQAPARTAPARPSAERSAPARTAPQRTESARPRPQRSEPARRAPVSRAIERAPTRSMPSRSTHVMQRSEPRESRSATTHGNRRGR